MKVTGTDLVSWADRLDARARLPELVRRLIHATTPLVQQVDFPAGEGVQKHGVDGRVLTLESSAYVPVGWSVWEMGTNQEPRAKANDDFEARLKNPPEGLDPLTTTFVFVTPRRWGDREKWATEKRALRTWADVRVYDADLLEQWLDLSPSVRSWLAYTIGLPHDTQSLDEAWHEWSMQTEPRTSESLVLAGRDDAQRALATWLGSAPSVDTAQLSDPDELAGFMFAALHQLPLAQRHRFIDRVLVVRSDATLRRVSAEGAGQIIIAPECKLELAKIAVAKGHHVIIPSVKPPNIARLVLGLLDQGQAVAALQRAGLSSEAATRHVADAHGDLSVLRRALGAPTPSADAAFAPLVLFAGWDEDNAHDLEVMAKVVGDTGRVNELIRNGSVGGDPLLTHFGTRVQWRSHAAAWRLLAEQLTHQDLKRFIELAVELLGTPDPKYELPPDKQFGAALYGKKAPESKELRHGIAEAILRLGASEASPFDHVDAADRIVMRLMRGLTSHDRWQTMDRLLPLLAEASPTCFLRGIREHLDDHPELMAEVVTGIRGGLFGDKNATGLVWAIEVLAWAPDYFAEALDLLVTLAEVDAGGNVHPRPKDAIEEILCPWMPHTMAPIEARIEAIGRIADRLPLRALELVSALLTKSSSTQTARPQLRDWTVSYVEGVTPLDHRTLVQALADLVVRVATAHPEVWPVLLKDVSRLPNPQRSTLLDSLGALDPASVPDSLQEQLRVALRAFLRHPPRHRKDEPAATEAQLQALSALLSRAEPADPTGRLGWLFANRVKLPDFVGDDWIAEQHAINARRSKAADELTAGRSVEEVFAMAISFERPFDFGWALAKNGVHRAVALELLRRALSEASEAAEGLRLGLVVGLQDQDAAEDVKALATKASDSEKLALAHALPMSAETWSLVESWGGSLAKAYWSKADPRYLKVPDSDYALAFKHLIAAQRPWSAIAFAALRADRSLFSAEAIVEALRLGSQVKPEGDDKLPESHHVVQLIRWLGKQTGVSEDVMAELEWRWFPALEHQHHPRHLFRLLERDPAWFVELVSLVYRGEMDPEEVDPKKAATAHQAWDVLHAWNTMPATSTDGELDAVLLDGWVTKATRELTARQRAHIGEDQIGNVLARSPVGADGHWPHEAVRAVIERARSQRLEDGFTVGKSNLRGMTTRDPFDGGAQEAALAKTYRAHEAALRARWPATGRCLGALARTYEREARNEDRDAAALAASMRHEAHAEDKLGVFIDELQSRGRYTFTHGEVVGQVGLGPQEGKRAADDWIRRGRVVSPEEGFYVIVRLEQQSLGAPSPDWYIDAWMRFAETPYYVGLLTAAALHGAGSQQPLTFQVVVPEERASVTVGRSKIVFFAVPDMPKRTVDERDSETASFRISGTEVTLCDLVADAERLGGIDAIAPVVRELSEMIDGARLAQLVDHYAVEVLQRVGFVLDECGASSRALELHAAIESVELQPIPLRADEPAGDAPENRWRVRCTEALDLAS